MMGYNSAHGRRPIERASKISHTEIVSNETVQNFLDACDLPPPPNAQSVRASLVPIPEVATSIRAVVAVDGGLNETFVREQFPHASIAFITFGPLYLELADLADLDQRTFIGPEDIASLKNLERYSAVIPTRLVTRRDCGSFSESVRKTVQEFLRQGDGKLLGALGWLLFQEWLPGKDRNTWVVPKCPTMTTCDAKDISFTSGGPVEQPCPKCGSTVYLADALRLYERIDDEFGAGAVLAYILGSFEHVAMIHIIRAILEMKPALLREVLLIKDGPLAFFGVTAPLHEPMRALMMHLKDAKSGPLINLVGVEKSGAYVEHAMQIEAHFKPYEALVLGGDYICSHVVPGDPTKQDTLKNTYFGAKVIFKGSGDDMYVVTVPTGDYVFNPTLGDLMNGADVLRTVAKLKCSMYDNALVPVALANRLVSLADVPSTEILTKFAKARLGV
jgi:hypothetical protein